MATAKAGPRRTTRKVTLNLTEGEADMLLALVSMVGGRHAQSPRKYAERVRRALETALGYDWSGTDAFHLGLGHVEFFDYKDHPEITTGMRARAVLESAGLQLHADFDPTFRGPLDLARATVEVTEFVEVIEALADEYGFSDLADYRHVSG